MVIEHLSDLHQDPKNARAHNPRNVGMIVDALREVGAARSGVIDEEGRILAGNATWEALAEAGIERVKVVEADGEEWVVVKRSGLTEEQKRRLALFDNRAAELAEWDIEVLADSDGLLDGLFEAWELDDLGVTVPDFAPVGVDEQPRLDQRAPVECPECGHEFIPS
jgi:ParB-like chromosome segregation protein Spo0J